MATKITATDKKKPRGKPFPPDNNANPNGRPVTELTVKFQLERKLKEIRKITDYNEKLENVVLMADDLVETYFKSEDPKVKLDYFKEIADRTEGKAVQRGEQKVLLKNTKDMSDEELLALTQSILDAD